MGLNSISFIICFFALFVLMSVLQIIRIKTNYEIVSRLQILILLLFSYCFVVTADWKFAVLLAAVTLIAYVSGLIIPLFKTVKKRRNAAIVSGVLLILILGYFKYTNFFIESVGKVFGFKTPTLNIILPLGISFFIFSALSYVIDVYRGNTESEKNILDFGLYISFFAKLTAGPIVRWTDFKPQIKEYRGITLTALNDGIQIFVFGLFKKMVLADHLGVFVNDVFKAPGYYGTLTVWWAALSYSLQIYLDFSGYSDMAIGIAKIVGFDFKPNFNLPYIAKGFSDFWGRWHISLSSWFKDYLYIPLGGSRKGAWRTYFNLLAVMFVSGLWHGAGWTFILWGILHGIASCITRAVKTAKNRDVNRYVINAFETVLTFVFVTLFWVVFRADNINNAFGFLGSMFTIHTGISQPYIWTLFALLCILFATVFAAISSRKKGQSRIDGVYPVMDLSKVWALIVFFTVCGLTVLLGYYGNTAFIYGAF